MIRSCEPQLRGGRPLVPYRRVRVRLVVLAALVVFILLGNPAWHTALVFAVSMALLLGTFPRTRFNETMLEREFLAMFIPVHAKQWQFDQFECILTGLEERSMFMDILFGGSFGGCLGALFMPVFERIFDSLMPWLGGDYKIWLQTHAGDRVLVWQGNGEHRFRTNLELLEKNTGLPVQRG